MRTWQKTVILGLIGALAGPLILSRVIPAVPLRSYFWLERKLDSQALRDLEPSLIKIGLLQVSSVTNVEMFDFSVSS